MGSIGLNTGLKALLSAQAALETIGHNVSNANTAGYSRQRLDLAASPSLLVRGLGIGSGVDALRVMRTTDALIQARIVAQTGSIARIDARLAGMSQVQALLGEPGEFGLSSLMEAMHSSYAALAADPADLVLRTSAVQSTVATTSQMNHLATSFAAAQDDVVGQIRAQAKQVNLLADDEVFPEFLTSRCAAAEMAAKILNWLDDPRECRQVRDKLADLRERFGRPGACAATAEFLRDHIPVRSRTEAVINTESRLRTVS